MGVGQGLGAIRRLLRLGMCKGVGGAFYSFFLFVWEIRACLIPVVIFGNGTSLVRVTNMVFFLVFFFLVLDLGDIFLAIISDFSAIREFSFIFYITNKHTPGLEAARVVVMDGVLFISFFQGQTGTVQVSV